VVPFNGFKGEDLKEGRKLKDDRKWEDCSWCVLKEAALRAVSADCVK